MNSSSRVSDREISDCSMLNVPLNRKAQNLLCVKLNRFFLSFSNLQILCTSNIKEHAFFNLVALLCQDPQYCLCLLDGLEL